MDKLSIHQINVNSILSTHKRHEMNEYLKCHKPDIVLVCETKLKGHKIYFKNYHFIRNDRTSDSGGGGTGILIKNSLKFNIVSPPFLNTMECTSVNLELDNGDLLFIFSIYVTPTNNIIAVKDMENIISCAGNHKFIMGGDFNARHAEKTHWKTEMEVYYLTGI